MAGRLHLVFVLMTLLLNAGTGFAESPEIVLPASPVQDIPIKTVETSPCTPFEVAMPAASGTGYSFSFVGMVSGMQIDVLKKSEIEEADHFSFKVMKIDPSQAPSLLGGPEMTHFRVHPGPKAGNYTLYFKLHRTFDPSAAASYRILQTRVNSASPNGCSN